MFNTKQEIEFQWIFQDFRRVTHKRDKLWSFVICQSKRSFKTHFSWKIVKQRLSTIKAVKWENFREKLFSNMQNFLLFFKLVSF